MRVEADATAAEGSDDGLRLATMEEVTTTRRTLGALRADCSRPAHILTLSAVSKSVLEFGVHFLASPDTLGAEMKW